MGMEALEAMTSDLGIYRAANELIKQHGDKAPIHAAMRADEMLEAGAMEGKAVWLRIARRLGNCWRRSRRKGRGMK